MSKENGAYGIIARRYKGKLVRKKVKSERLKIKSRR